MLSSESLAKIDQALTKYPADQKQSAVMAALTIAQDEQGLAVHARLMDFVAEYLGMPPIAVYEVASFYDHVRPRAGRASTSCASAPTCPVRCRARPRRPSI